MNKTMPARYARSLLRLLPEHQQAEVLQELGLDKREIESDVPVALERYARLFSLVLSQLQVVLHGDEAETIQRFSCYRLILESMVQAPDLAESLDRAAACFRRIAADQSTITTHIEDRLVCVEFRVPQQEASTWSLECLDRDVITFIPGLTGQAALLWVWHRLFSWLIGNYIGLEAVEFTEPVPEHPEKYRELFHTEAFFQRQRLALLFPKRYLDKPIVQTPASVAHLLEDFLLPLFLIAEQGDSVTSRIKALIGNNFSSPLPSFASMADRLNTTVPTLHRRLQKEQTNYQKIKDECRKDAAVDLLIYSNMPIRVVAEHLGFSDSGTFHRAFRKWMGMTPTEFRRRNR